MKLPLPYFAKRWLAVYAAATAGSWIGRVVAAEVYGESVTPLLKADARLLLEQDVAPGFLASEFLGRGRGIAGQATIALVAAAVSAVATGGLRRNDD